MLHVTDIHGQTSNDATDRPRELAAALVGLDGVVAVALEPPGGPGGPPGAVVVDTLSAPLLRRSRRRSRRPRR